MRLSRSTRDLAISCQRRRYFAGGNYADCTSRRRRRVPPRPRRGRRCPV